MPVAKRVRFEVLRRDNHQCRYCGATAPDTPLTVDHVTPVVLGGSDDPSNLVAACVDCNAGKTSTTPDANIVADVTQKALEFARVQRIVFDELERQAEADAQHRAKILAAFRARWDIWKNQGEPLPLPVDWRTSIIQFAAAGYPIGSTLMEQHIEITMSKSGMPNGDVFRYLCGIIHKTVRLAAESTASVIQNRDGP